MDKNILTKLMKLESRVANKKLEAIAIELAEKIKKSKSNDDCLEKLDLIESIVYRVPTQTLEIAKYLINQIPLGKNKYKTKVKTFDNKDYNQIIIKIISLLKELRFIRPNEVFQLLIILSENADSTIKSKAIEALEKQIEYNYHIIIKIDLGIQEKLLRDICSWSINKKKKYIEAISMILKKLLDTSFEGTTMKDEITLVFHRGSLKPTNQLRDIRNSALKLGFQLFKSEKDAKTRLQILKIFKRAFYGPDHGSIEDHENLKPIIKDGLKQILEKYRHTIFKTNGSLSNDLAIIYEIEEQLVLLNANYKTEIPEISKLIQDIRNDKSIYSIYRILSGDMMDFRLDGDYLELKKQRKEDIEELLKNVNIDNIKWWKEVLNSIAKNKDTIERWKLNSFRDFLARVAIEKPDVAKLFIDDSYANNKPLKYFTESFLAGFRVSNNLHLWDKYKDLIVADKDVELLAGLLESYEFIKRDDLKNMRLEDLKILEFVTKKVKPFDFLKKEKNNHRLHYSIMRYLLYVYKANPKKIKPLIVREIKNHAQFANSFIDQFGFAFFSEWFDIKDWTIKELETLHVLLTEVSHLDHHALQLLKHLLEQDFRRAMNVFILRIIKSTKDSIKRDISRYEAIPHHIDHDFKDYVSKHKEYSVFIKDNVQKMTPEWSVYNWDLSRLLQHIGGNSYYEVQKMLITSGKKNDIKKVMYLFDIMQPPSIDLVLKIIETVSDKKVWYQLIGKLSATGVVFGEYGIANAHKIVLEEIKTKTAKSKSKNIITFAKIAIDNFEKRIVSEIKNADEDRALRNVEFQD